MLKVQELFHKISSVFDIHRAFKNIRQSSIKYFINYSPRVIKTTYYYNPRSKLSESKPITTETN